MSIPVSADWLIELNTTCPKCEAFFDILAYDPDICMEFEIGEYETERTSAVDVTCPKCRHEFLFSTSD